MEANLIEKLKNQHADLTKSQIEGILYLIQNGTSLNLTQLIGFTGLPKTVLVEFLKSIGYLLNESKDKIEFNFSANQEIRKLELNPYKWTLLEEDAEQLAITLTKLREKYFFSQKREYDQFFATPQTSIRKALAVQAKAGIKGIKIALLGDDDLLSFAIPLLSQEYAEIVVFDIDKEQLTNIEAAAKQEGFKNVKTQHYDARESLPQKYLNYFDVVFTDPPYTKTGFDLFLDRCIELVKISKDYSGSYIYICYGIGLKNIEREAKLLESIHIRNLYIEDKIFKFNKYQGAETVGNASSLYILKTTPFTSTIQNSNIENIYTFENVKEEKFPYVDHYVFKLYGVDAAILKSKNKVTAVVGDFCNRHRLKVMNTYVTQFKPFGLSLTYILSNSNLIVHTWEEYDAVHVDLVTCSPVFNATELSNNLNVLFKARHVEYYKVA
ncbi:bis-aminopropyl spermidine synthase family protein [Patescibacteria group bacterium]|nr:bis-aminopropyl spermidine synthase family protein [Patescibacteria group bacterium]